MTEKTATFSLDAEAAILTELQRSPAVLVLEDGRIFRGRAYGATGSTTGEAVFNTGMTGYQETLTDPSYHRQVVVMTAPHIGNTGVNDHDVESRRIWVAGYVIREAALRPSNWRSQRHLEDELREQGIVGICGVDTRAITRHLRTQGAMRVGIFSGTAAEHSDTELLEQVRSAPQMAGAALVDEVTVAAPVEYLPEGEPAFVVALVDLGIKDMSIRNFTRRGVKVVVLPASATFDDVMSVRGVHAEHGPDGVFFSNGPGDPATADHQVDLLQQVLRRRVPYFGICFGNQILGRALGFNTYKLRFGHRGINQPVKVRATGKVDITAQNHGFAVDAPIDEDITAAANASYGRVRVSHVGLNDNVVEGLQCLDIPAFSVQFHPEAAAGPHDSQYVFDQFIALMGQVHGVEEVAAEIRIIDPLIAQIKEGVHQQSHLSAGEAGQAAATTTERKGH
ncbi:glutamine-hydrolyzing carbamoyl-phosphate synthase small subunit [Dermatophilus congolensis]|uniref:Carbamoyl phosphate synthase small chain n=1 Tax=Dermatophilus congolensis TaxID=1863 RepID=A0A239VGU9_9MICO|nr:Carbamoyl-phosphate synthase small chain [Dermatophilus congolensis]